MRCLLDTNILTRLSYRLDPEHPAVLSAAETLARQGHTLCLVPQTVYEFWTVATRPANVNGLALSTSEAQHEISTFLDMFEFYPDQPEIFSRWLELVTRYGVSGKPAHDARLAAAYLVHGCDTLLTLNTPDFKRFGIHVLHPQDVNS